MFHKTLRKAKVLSSVLAAAMLAGCLGGCSGNSSSSQSSSSSSAGSQSAGGSQSVSQEQGSQAAAAKDPVTIKVLMSGDKPNDWDKVVEEFYTRTKDTLNTTFDWTWVPSADYKDKLNVKMTAGEEYDLVFDAPWMHLRTLSQDGVYADLSPYLNNDAYPGLRDCFPEEIMKFNKYADINCALPLMFTYADINIVMYRQDWAREAGIGTDGQITSHEELQKYLDMVLETKEGVTPIALKDNRGFYHLFEAITVAQQKNHIYMGSLGKDIFFAIKLNDEENQVLATALPGDAAEYWEPFGGTDFWQQKLEKQREWNKYCETDSMNQTNPGSVFQIGKAGACIDTIDAVPKFNQLLHSNVPEAELGVYVHDTEARNMEKGVYNAVVTSNNCLCIPSNSKNIDRTIDFLNWMFEDPANHDLFEYGIEGVHWEPVGERQYKYPSGVSITSNYNPNGWNLSWTPKYYRFSESYTDYSVPYAEYATEFSNFKISGMAGFTFKSDPVKTEVVQCGNILGEILVPLNHGILENPYQVMQNATLQLRANDVQKGIDEYVSQLNEFLANKK